MKTIEQFLINNGFVEVESPIPLVTSKFENTKCIVYINPSNYEVGFKDTKLLDDSYVGLMFSDNLNIYWLVGLLTWYDLIDKNYKQ